MWSKLQDSGEGIAIDLVGTPSEPLIIVYLGGTNPDQWGSVNLAGLEITVDSATNQPKLENIDSFVFQQPKSEHLAAIDWAVAKATNAKVMLVGYSQGGMDAQNIAESGRYDVSTVVTFGSPIVAPASTEYESIHFWDPRDNIARLTFMHNTLGLFSPYLSDYRSVEENNQLFRTEADGRSELHLVR